MHLISYSEPAVATEESTSQFKFRILTALSASFISKMHAHRTGKLDDRDAQARASDELKQVIDELTAEQLSTLVVICSNSHLVCD